MLKQKHAERRRQDLAVAAAIKKANKAKKQTRVSGPKRRAADNLLSYISIPIALDIRVRSIESFTNKSYSLEKQVRALIDHLYVKYPVPEFLYPAVYSEHGRHVVLRLEKADANKKVKKAIVVLEHKLFFACASGASVAPLLKEWLTKKEVHVFLGSPADFSITEGMLWAKLKVAGVSDDWIGPLIRRF
ncbi:MAG TPA: hypothetical protein VK171_02980, partial [Fimbriimonas sp.]|nr:hypothetical protein [Fimbriimonas sp.]